MGAWGRIVCAELPLVEFAVHIAPLEEKRGMITSDDVMSEPCISLLLSLPLSPSLLSLFSFYTPPLSFSPSLSPSPPISLHTLWLGRRRLDQRLEFDDVESSCFVVQPDAVDVHQGKFALLLKNGNGGLKIDMSAKRPVDLSLGICSLAALFLYGPSLSLSSLFFSLSLSLSLSFDLCLSP
jgi:hypothetical protein